MRSHEPNLATVESICARLAEEHDGAAPSLLAFDADGTLWSGDVGIDLFEALLRAQLVHPHAESALAAEAYSFGLSTSGGANALAKALYASFQRGEYPEEKAFGMMAWVFGGWLLDDLGGFARDVLKTQDHTARIRESMRRLVQWAHDRGIRVAVVSGSPRTIVELGVALFGISGDNVVATTPRTRDGVVLPELDGPVIYADKKVQGLRARLGSQPILAAFGDSGYDADLLQASRIPVAVNPKPGLIAAMSSIPNIVCLMD